MTRKRSIVRIPAPHPVEWYLEKVREVELGELGKKCGGILHREGVYLSFDSFHRNRHSPDGMNNQCKACIMYDRWTDKEAMERKRKNDAAWAVKYNRKKSGNTTMRKSRVEKRVQRLENFIDGRDESGAAERLQRFLSGGEYEEE